MAFWFFSLCAFASPLFSRVTRTMHFRRHVRCAITFLWSPAAALYTGEPGCGDWGGEWLPSSAL